MTRTIYALLVGIDDYPMPVPPLSGCVNDIRRVEELLSERVTGADDRFQPKRLTDRNATRAGILEAFRTHLGQAGPGDVALFYYSGHGSQQPSPPEFWMLESDHLDETIVCYDSRLPGNWDLADKELGQLIADVAENGPHVLVILDCCHSGSGTRDAEMPEEGVTIRRVPTDQRVRPIDTFDVSPEQAAALQTGATTHGDDPGSGWVSLPAGRHVVFSACSAEEEAKELFLGGERRGAFSYYLMDTLTRTGEALSYRDMHKRVNAQVRLRVSAQSPQLEATETLDLGQPFLGGAIQSGPRYYTARYDGVRQWVIDGGAVHGIPAPDGDETTSLALFSMDANVDQLRDLSGALGSASVTEVFPGESAVAIEMDDDEASDTGTTYKAVVTALPLPPLVVALEGDPEGLVLLREELDHAGPDGDRSLLVRPGTPEEAELYVRAVEEGYRIRRKGDEYKLTFDTEGFNEAGAALTVQRLEHIARWMQVGKLQNAVTSLEPNAVRLEILIPDKDGEWVPATEGSTIRLEYKPTDEGWKQPAFKAKLTNSTDQRLYCMLYDLPETFGIFPLLPGGGEWLEPYAEIWANQGNPYYASVRDELWEAGVIEFKDALKLIYATDECDATLLAQDDLPVTVGRSLTRAAPSHMNSLNRLMMRVPSRHFDDKPADSETFADWDATEVSFTTVRPLETTPIPDEGDRAVLGHGVMVHGHSGLQAKARLSDLPETSRDAGNLTLPSILRDHPDVFKPFEFSASRSGNPGLSVIELSDVSNHELVTPESPLTVEIERPLAEDEALLTFGFDGEFYLPTGYARRHTDRTEVVLERLPAPTSHGSRDLAGAIRIYFQKVVGQRIGLEFPYPVLATADVAEDGAVTYHPAHDAVLNAVAASDRILLYLHGIIGDTRSLASSARTASLGLALPPPALAERYDLILTFDYESINTTIEEIARSLKQRLADAGLGPNHSKTLHLVAHSMGGLVARWFVEREEGNRVVQHLVAVGTPNAGSPWPTIQDWALTALAVGINSLSTVAWPVKVLAALVKATEAVDVSLDQMKPQSDFLKSLESSADPGIPYTVIAGNTSVNPSALEPEGDGGESRFARLWDKIKKTNWINTGANLAFFNRPNDLASTVTSQRGVPADRNPPPVSVEIPCDHMSYFRSRAGLQALADAMKPHASNEP